MRRHKSKATSEAKVTLPKKVEGTTVSASNVVRREYAGQYVAWAPNGLSIVAVASSFDLAERKAATAGYPKVAVARIPKGRTIN
jgi:hypothetical protein